MAVNFSLLLPKTMTIDFLTGYGGVSSKTTTSDSGHTNGFLPNGGGSSNGVGSGGGVWTGETLSSLSVKSSAESSNSGDGDGADDRFFSVDGYATGSRRRTARQQQLLQGRLAPAPAPPYRDARRGGEDLVPSSR